MITSHKNSIGITVLLATLISLILIKDGQAQDQFFISSSAGLAIPIGIFSSDYRAESSSHVGIETGYYFTEDRNWGVGTKIAFSSHSMSPGLNSSFERTLIEENIPYIISTTSTDWKIVDWNAGIYGQAHFGEAVSLEGKLRLGILWITSPENLTTLTTPSGTSVNNQFSATESVFNLNGEVALKYNLGWASIYLYSSLLSVQPQISTSTDLSPNWPIDYTYRDSFLANVSIITFGLGVETRF